jgi:hypothetical protein
LAESTLKVEKLIIAPTKLNIRKSWDWTTNRIWEIAYWLSYPRIKATYEVYGQCSREETGIFEQSLDVVADHIL